MTIIYFILMLSVIITVHELGHLLTAKFFGVYCHEFSFGMGPRLWSKQGKETIYSIRALPFGGFVRMAGEEALEGDPEVPPERQLTGIKPYQKMIIMLSGIFMNIITALLLSTLLYGILGSYVKYPEPIIASVTENSPAEAAGFQAGDLITTVTYANGITIHPETFYTVVQYLQAYPQEADYTVKRGDETLTLTVTPNYEEAEERYYIGITMNKAEVIDITPLNAPYYGALYVKEMTRDIFNTLGNLFRGKGLENLSGPVGIYQATDETMSNATSTYERLVYFINILALLSLNVGIFNLLPVPLFDGGRVILSIAEVIIGHPLDKKVEAFLINGSALLVMILFVFVMWNDISRLFG